MTTSNLTRLRLASEARRWLILNTKAPTELLIEAEPRPESLRAGVRGGRAFVYKGKLYNEFLADAVRQLSEQKPLKALSGDIFGVVEVIVTRPASTKKARPSGDVDNLAKGVQDAITQAGAWDDDDSIVSLTVVKRWTEPGEKAGVKVLIGELKDE